MAPMETPKSEQRQPQSNPISPWTHDETTHLINAYKDKWSSLRRGQLKSAHWEEVSVTVAARSGHDDPSASKSSLQCRHKMEKLRRRFRSESARLGPAGCAWPFFAPMDQLLRGPLPISALPMAVDGGENAMTKKKKRSRSQSLNVILRRDSDCEGVSENSGFDGGLVAGVAAEIRVFAERLAAIGRVRMEAARETEREMIEMERKRIDMIVTSQAKILDSIATAFD